MNRRAAKTDDVKAHPWPNSPRFRSSCHRYRQRLGVVLVAAVLPLFTPALQAQAPTTVFKGRPSVKISEGGLERLPEPVARDKAVNLEIVISQIGDSYYWASRENTELIRLETGGYITFIALNGSGYVRILKPEAKKAAGLLNPTEGAFDYVEHLLIGLRSVTYYGTRWP